MAAAVCRSYRRRLLSDCMLHRGTSSHRYFAIGVTTPEVPAGFAVIPAVVDEVLPSPVAILTDNGQGSGVVYDGDGTIVTNAHVVGDASEVTVAFSDGKRFAGKVIATDEVVDIALVETDRAGLVGLAFADDLPDIGELAIAIGSSLGLRTR